MSRDNSELLRATTPDRVSSLHIVISSGTRLGPYEVIAPIGAGGMGEVYRARDLRLDRTVAIKVLPHHLSADARLRERFEREAKAISSLSHPNICALFDVGSHDGVDFLVMEYLEGESLADRLSRGPLPLEQVVRYGVEIAEALAKAHRSGIVHRDLKPANVILTRDGAKLLDFGLAKFAKGTAGSSHPDALTAALSHDKPLTEEGTIVGTFMYMAPEQIEGHDADARTDIFALGVLLYEMTTGRRAFEAKTRASLIAAILEREPPPIVTTQPLAPGGLDRIVRMCMAKDPDDRWQSAHDVAAELRWVREGSSAAAESLLPQRRKRSRALRAAALLGLGVLTGAAAAWLGLRQSDAPPPAAHFVVHTDSSAPLLHEYQSFAISPEGTHLVYRGLVGDKSQLVLRPLGSANATPLPGTENGHSPVFSPDGRWIAFMDSELDAVIKVPRAGGSRTKIAESPGGGLGLDWEGDTIYMTRAFADGLWAVPASGGEAHRIANIDPASQQRAIVWPDAIPGTNVVLATAWNAGAWDTARILAYPTDRGEPKVVIEGASFARYSPTGHLLFMRGGHLMAVPFDAKTLEAGRNAVAVVNRVAHGSADGEAHFAISPAGHLVYASGGDVEPQFDLVWLDQQGRRTKMVPTPRRYGSVSLVPGEQAAIVTLEGSTYDVWQLDLERDSLTRISHGGDDADGVVTSDGARVIWVSSRSGPYNLYWRPLDNSAPEEALKPSEHSQFVPTVVPGGTSIVYGEFGSGKRSDIWEMSLETRSTQPLITGDFAELAPAVSPDRQWLAFTSDESGRAEVYVTTYPQPGGKWQISTSGGGSPRWMPDGRSIVYGTTGQVLVASFETTPRPRAGNPRVIATGPFDDDYDIAPDGRIAVIEGDPHVTANEFHVVLNWATQLTSQVPRD